MMNDLTYVIVGGGHAGIGVLKAIQETTRGMVNGRQIQIVLIDKQPGHVRKVMLFRPAAGGEEIIISWRRYLSEGAEFVQGTVTSVDSEKKWVRYIDVQGNDTRIHYDCLILTVGSIVREPGLHQGGIALSNLQAAQDIRECWCANLWKAVRETNLKERKRLMKIAVAGAGISGIETSAELAEAMRKEASAIGLNPSDVSVYLLNGQERLFPGGPEKVGRKLDQMLSKCGVTVIHNRKAMREKAGVLKLNNGDCLTIGLCVWTAGLIPNPVLRNMNLPLTPDGQMLVDECYRVQGVPDVYSIGDCARIIDPSTGKMDQMTCKEAGPQAVRLGKIMMADLEGRPAPVHKSVMDAFAIGLGKNRGLVWVRKWGINMIITGKLAWKIKKLAWDWASQLR
ncbi:oxidoreductase [Bacillus sp. J14TS2]|uniref:NAD(P)/FAD-dependent oxidoreductase n=1 Tax=Bacillus sp. J14TS2 TaxID=2807188 RepID=UPI001B1850F9|nr:FAD-dependent oxidoreductase [Bacillus sp. J14TS2]GIN74905.1 oxidoreductase [Bacillus sp. J14TS2]